VSLAPTKNGFKNPSVLLLRSLVVNWCAPEAVLAAGQEISPRNSGGKVCGANHDF
jgi:hypothetical protein